jgi:hypothetical protein
MQPLVRCICGGDGGSSSSSHRAASHRSTPIRSSCFVDITSLNAVTILVPSSNANASVQREWGKDEHMGRPVTSRHRQTNCSIVAVRALVVVVVDVTNIRFLASLNNALHEPSAECQAIRFSARMDRMEGMTWFWLELTSTLAMRTATNSAVGQRYTTTTSIHGIIDKGRRCLVESLRLGMQKVADVRTF